MLCISVHRLSWQLTGPVDFMYAGCRGNRSLTCQRQSERRPNCGAVWSRWRSTEVEIGITPNATAGVTKRDRSPLAVSTDAARFTDTRLPAFKTVPRLLPQRVRAKKTKTKKNRKKCPQNKHVSLEVTSYNQHPFRVGLGSDPWWFFLHIPSV